MLGRVAFRSPIAWRDRRRLVRRHAAVSHDVVEKMLPFIEQRMAPGRAEGDHPHMLACSRPLPGARRWGASCRKMRISRAQGLSGAAGRRARFRGWEVRAHRIFHVIPAKEGRE